MKIVTWNIAGIKARLDTLVAWLEQFQPDVVCLQEIKSTDDKFPSERIAELGYHIEKHGQKSFNGVAILSKKSPDEVNCSLPGDDNDQQARFIEAVFSVKSGVVRVASLYLPNGNPVQSDKYPYKIAWMQRLHDFAQSRLKLEEPMVLAGDYNVIPAAFDARHPESWVDDALYLPQTRQAFFKLCNLGFTDAIRAVNDEQSFSFWDFQGGAWPKDHGIRIDHMLLSPQAADLLENAYVQREIRGWEKPSDHVPVWIELNSTF